MSLTQNEALAICNQGQDFVVSILVTYSAEIDKLKKELEIYQSKEVTRPSGKKAPFEKPNKKKRKRKAGQKKGHKGKTRAKPLRIDKIEEHILNECPNEGGPLGDPIATRSRIIEDINLDGIKTEFTQHDINRYYCPEEQKIVEPKVDAAPAGCTIGVNLIVLTAWLHYILGMSISGVIRTLGLFLSTSISRGGLIGMWNNFGKHLYPIYEQIQGNIRLSAVLNCDETGWRVDGATWWMWVFCDKSWCYYLIDKSRAGKVALRVIGSFLNGILITDFYGAYNGIVAIAKQKCLYHLLTELKKVSIRNAGQEWKAFEKELKRLLKDGIRLLAKKKDMTPDDFYRRRTYISQRFKEFLKNLAITACDKDVRRLLKRLRRHKDEIFIFLDYEGVSPYNNHGEQQIRPGAVIRNNSHGNRSIVGASTQSIIMTVFQSLKLQGFCPVRESIKMYKQAIRGETPTWSVKQENVDCSFPLKMAA
ncbi:MAG: IS66 family transposase [Oligoflexia bacterium]|nr:IS66 family transposase [Oligoflexia bacterium]